MLIFIILIITIIVISILCISSKQPLYGGGDFYIDDAVSDIETGSYNELISKTKKI